MKAALLIEDRDEGYLFLDVENAPKEAQLITVELDDDVSWSEAGNEELVMWLVHEEDTSRHRVSRFDIGNSNIGENGWFPVPTPTILKDKSEYERFLSQ